jgi:hypothetical protein
MVYTNDAIPGAKVGELAPPWNPGGAGRNRTLICQSVYRTGEHDENGYAEADASCGGH